VDVSTVNSSGAVDAQIFTNDREKLPAALGHDVSKQTAQAFQISTEQTITPQQEISTGRQQEHSTGSESAFKTLPAPDRGA
jgi:hypothetical protein